MSKALAIAFGGGGLSALLYLSILTGDVSTLILGYLAPLPLFLVGLWMGFGAAALGGAAGAVLIVVMSGSLMVLVSYLATGAFPAALVVRQALLARTAPDGTVEWYPPGLLLTLLTQVGLGLFVVGVVATFDQPGGLEGLMRSFLGGLAARLEGEPAAVPEAMSEEFTALAAVLPGFVVISWLVMTVVNGVLAQGVLMRFGANRRPPMRMADLELPRWIGWAWPAAVLGAMVLPDTAGFVALNAALILVVPFVFAGLAVVHTMVGRRPGRPVLLVMVYTFLFLFGWPFVIVAGLGVIEQWIGLRRRLRMAGPNQEDE